MSENIRHKTFISYHHDDQEEVDNFIETFDNERDVFIARAVGSDATLDDLIESDDEMMTSTQCVESERNISRTPQLPSSS